MSLDRRLNRLEQGTNAAPRDIPDSEAEDYCGGCLGYGRLIDLAWARINTAGGREAYSRLMAERAKEPPPPPAEPRPCKGCSGLIR